MDRLTHADVWRALDSLAAAAGLTPSGLAKRAGLDPTIFNRSKRMSSGPGGRARWPSTESVARVLEATATDLEQFARLAAGSGAGADPKVPLIGLARAGSGGFFDENGLPCGAEWDLLPAPWRSAPGTYALEITGDSMLPVYRPGDRIIVDPSVEVRRGDRVVVRTRDGEVMAKTLLRQSATDLELGSFNAEFAPRQLSNSDLDWIARIVWASQ